MKIVCLKFKTILLGVQKVSELTILEYKKVFSIKLFYFHKSKGIQDRFHTHAFKAYSILFFGNYIEELYINNHIIQLNRNRKRFLFIPKNVYHRITKSNGCLTLLITGKWGDTFKELFLDENNNVIKETLNGEHRTLIKELNNECS